MQQSERFLARAGTVFDVELGLALQPAAGLDAIEVAVDVELEQNRRVISRSARGGGICALKAKSAEIECLREGITYSVPLYVKLRLREEDFIKDEDIFMGEIPMVTDRGSFIINGAERVVVSQLHRSPGIAFEVTPHPNGKPLHSFRIIPDRGTWLEVQFDNNDLLYVYLDPRVQRA